MKTFQYFKDKFRSKGQRSAPELTEERKSEEYSGLDRTTKYLFSEAFPRSIPELYEAKAHNLRVLSFSELRRATRDFGPLLAIGRGGFGDVYKGTIKPADGKGEPLVVAIKKLRMGSVQVIHRDFKPSNVFLDDKFNAKLSGFGFATEGPMAGDTHVSTDVSGTIGYADPCYSATGHLTVYSDVWGFSVVLYEVLSGKQSIDRELPQAEERLLHWMKRFPADSKKFSSIMDPGLGNQYSIDAARKFAKLADACLLTSPKGRPKMSEVVKRLKQIIQVSEEGSADKMESHPEASESEIKAGEPETNSNTAELVAIKYAMESFLKAARKGEALLIIESDSTTAVQWIQDYDSRPMKLRPMLQEIDTLISQIGTVVFNITL